MIIIHAELMLLVTWNQSQSRLWACDMKLASEEIVGASSLVSILSIELKICWSYCFIVNNCSFPWSDQMQLFSKKAGCTKGAESEEVSKPQCSVFHNPGRWSRQTSQPTHTPTCNTCCKFYFFRFSQTFLLCWEESTLEQSGEEMSKVVAFSFTVQSQLHQIFWITS